MNISIKLEGLLMFLFASMVMGSGVGYSKVWLFHVLSFFFLIAWCYQSILGKVRLLFWPRSIFINLLLLFFSWYAVGVLWSIDKINTLQYLFYLVSGLWVVFLISSYARSKVKYENVFRIISRVAVLALVIGIFEAVGFIRLPTSPYSEYAEIFGRKATDFDLFLNDAVFYIKSSPTSFWGNPNGFAVAMAMLAPFFYFARSAFVKLAGVFLVIFLIIMAGSRGSLLGLGFGWIFLFLLTGGLKKFIFYIPFIFGLFYFFDFFVDLLLSSGSAKLEEIADIGVHLSRYFLDENISEDSVGVRRELISNGLDALINTYGLGVGGGGSIAVQQALGPGTVTSMHNFWVEILVEGGFFGLLIFVFFYLLLCYRLLMIFYRSKDIFFRYHSAALLSAMVIFSVACISASSVIYFLPMWLMFGLSVALTNLLENERKRSARNDFSW